MELKDYTTEELRAELKRRNAEERAKKASKIGKSTRLNSSHS